MKHTFLLLVLISAILLVVVSCKKKNDAETTAQKIQAKWQIINIVSNDHFNGTDDIVTETGGPGDYYDIRSDGHIYTLFQGSSNTVVTRFGEIQRLLLMERIQPISRCLQIMH